MYNVVILSFGRYTKLDQLQDCAVYWLHVIPTDSEHQVKLFVPYTPPVSVRPTFDIVCFNYKPMSICYQGISYIKRFLACILYSL